MRIVFIFVGVVLINALVCADIKACQPCVEQLNLRQTLSEASLIIIGQKSGEALWTRQGNSPGGPEWINVSIHAILKGDERQQEIRVNSWDGMCSYGVQLDAGDYVIFLSQRDSPDAGFSDDYEYDAVNIGCGVKALLLKDDAIEFNGEKITIAQLKTWIDER